MPKQTNLDKIDLKIIREMQNNVRQSNKELAAKIGLSPSSCLARVRQLQVDGVFSGFHAHVRPKHLGAQIEAFIGVRLTRHSQQLVKSFQSHALGLDEVVAVYHVAGAIDFHLHVVVKDTEHMRKFVLGPLTSHSNVSRVETSLLFDSVQKPIYPSYLEN